MPESHTPTARSLEPAPPPTPRQEAADALNKLRAALHAHGIVLPSLDLDRLSLRGHDMPGPEPRPLIELGRCNLDTARQLTRALTPGDEG